MTLDETVDPGRTLSISLEAPLATVLIEVERLYLSSAMTRAKGNRVEAAKLAGMPLDTFRKKVKKYTVETVITLV